MRGEGPADGIEGKHMPAESQTVQNSILSRRSPRQIRSGEELGSRYKWIALSNTTLGVLMATVNSSTMLIGLPDIFRGIHIDPLAPAKTG
jgi:hypothetical protein